MPNVKNEQATEGNRVESPDVCNNCQPADNANLEPNVVEACSACSGKKHDAESAKNSMVPEKKGTFASTEEYNSTALSTEAAMENISLQSELPSGLTRADIAKAWWKAARPPFYIATLIPLFLGYFAARNDVYSPSVLVFTGVILVGFILHLAANLANDLYDYLQGTDTSETIGGSRGLQDGTISLLQLRRAIWGCYAATAFLALLGVWITGLWGLLLIALFGALSSYYYVAPPIKYGYRALGELFVFLNMGLVMTGGSYYALTGQLESYVLALSIPVGLMVAGILYYQSLPEIETDADAGKRTLVGVLGPEKSIFLFKLWWPGVWLLILMLYWAELMDWPALLGILAGIPLYYQACKKIDNAGDNWLSLDAYGKYVRLMYLTAGAGLLIGVATV